MLDLSSLHLLDSIPVGRTSNSQVLIFGNSETSITTPDISPNFSLSSAEYHSAVLNPVFLQNVTASIHYLGHMLTNGTVSLETKLEDVTINNVGKRRTVYG